MRLLPLLSLLVLLLLGPAPLWAGPVSWQEVPPTAEGQQWWDEGSLRFNRSGHLTVLSRFQPAAGEDTKADAPRPPGRLYVMELDCDQSLYRDISINGLPQFGAPWQPTGQDDLTAEVLRQACAAMAS